MRPLPAAASCAVQSRFLLICTLPPLLSNCRVTSRWPLVTADLRDILPSLPLISTPKPWLSNKEQSQCGHLKISVSEVSKHYYLHYLHLAPCFNNSLKTSTWLLKAAPLICVETFLFTISILAI